MQPKGVTKLVVDLRGNTGGYFPGGVDVARLLLPDKTDISFVNDYKGAELSYSTYSDGMAACSKCPPLAGPQLVPCASSGRAWRLCWLDTLPGRARAGESSSPPPRVLELAAPKVAHFTAVDPSGMDMTTPLYVLVDAKTASASEILASALQDNKRAQLVGSKTYGKAVIQNVGLLSDGSVTPTLTLPLPLNPNPDPDPNPDPNPNPNPNPNSNANPSLALILTRRSS